MPVVASTLVFILHLNTNLFNNKLPATHATFACPGTRRIATKSRSNHCFHQSMCALLLLLAGDVHPNPGPVNTCSNSNQPLVKNPNGKSCKFPCGVCSHRVQWNSKAIQCDECSVWFHVKCMGMGWQIFHANEEHKNYNWVCYNCGQCNVGGSGYTNNSIELSNSFESLASLPQSTNPFKTQSTTTLPLKSTKRSRNKTVHVNNMKVIVVNLNSLVSVKKRALFTAMIDRVNPDAVLGTETKLSSDFNTAELSLPNFKVFRKDRNIRGGGVLIAVRNTFTSIEIDTDETCELLWVKVQDVRRKFKTTIFGCFYNPPPSKDASITNFIKSTKEIKSQYPSSNMYIGGDLNLKDIDWENLKVCDNGEHKSSCNLLLDGLQSTSLEQIVHKPTRGSSILDLFITDKPDSVTSVDIIPGISDHEIVECNISTHIQPNHKQPRTIYRYDRVDMDGVKRDTQMFRDCYLNGNQSQRSVNENYDLIKKHLSQILVNNVPSKRISGRHTNPWVTDKIRRLINQRRNMYNKIKSQGEKPRENKKYLDFDKFVKNSIDEGYVDFINKMFDTNVDPLESRKRFYKFCKAQRTDQFGIPPLKNENEIVTESIEKANLLNNHLSNAFTRENLSNIPNKGNSPYPKMPNFTITTNGVAKLLSSLNPSKATGPDCIPGRLLKLLSEEIAPVIASFFQQSLKTGTVPDDFRKAIVTPIFKKGRRCDPGNYRPISLTCILCKCLEHIVTRNVMTHLESNGILSNLQHGFRTHRSCETQLLLTTFDFAKALNQKKQTDAILLDFTKAFDRVAHQRLLHKLAYYGVTGHSLAWIKSFLSERKQSVVLDGVASAEIDVLSGVPQGTVLGPVLFLCFINDISDGISSNIKLFADDALLYRTVETHEDTAKLQKDLTHLETWAKDWQMEFNAKKCFVLNITKKRRVYSHKYKLNNTELEIVHDHPYLGINIDDKLNWNAHVNKVCSKATRSLNFIKRNLKHCPQATRELSYFTYVRPQLEYATSVWNPSTVCNINALEKVNRCGARFVCNNYRQQASPTVMMKKLHWNNLQERRHINDLTQMHKISHCKYNINLDNILKPLPQRTRSNHRAYMNNFHTVCDAMKNCFFPRTIPSWNKLPSALVDVADTKMFRRKITEHLQLQ